MLRPCVTSTLERGWYLFPILSNGSIFTLITSEVCVAQLYFIMPHPYTKRAGTGLSALALTQASGEVGDNRADESFQGFRVQEPEHAMRHPHGVKAL